VLSLLTRVCVPRRRCVVAAAECKEYLGRVALALGHCVRARGYLEAVLQHCDRDSTQARVVKKLLAESRTAPHRATPVR
jgi:hypothetical protein